MSFKMLEKLGFGLDKFRLRSYKDRLSSIKSFQFDLHDDQELKQRSGAIKNQVREGARLSEVLPEAYALAVEVLWRILSVRLYDVQIIAGISLYDGKLIEMKTGEGKTFAAALPAYLNGMLGKGVHVLTFNDYLARRDAQWLQPVYDFLGVKTAFIREGMSPEERKRAYAADITYLTAKEAGFDYLRDSLCCDRDLLVHRPFHIAIVDEADSILIDEARVPLVIAGETEPVEEHYLQMAEIAKKLKQGLDFSTDEYQRNIFLTESGAAKVEELLDCGNLYELNNAGYLTAITSAIHAKTLLKKDSDYIVRNGKVELVDEFTGRVADLRRWPDGLQAAVEAKEGLKLQPAGKVLGSITLQHLIRMYPQVSGMTATALTSADEFKEIYSLDVVPIPLHQECNREDHQPSVYTHKQAKQQAIIHEIAQVHETGRPILVGTASVEESAQMAGDLNRRGIECHVLNAKNDEEEAKIIADAGALRAVTVSTNMAGRGVDIRLGGRNQETLEQVKELGGLYVIGTNLHESVRVDKQLKGRAGRQGDPGDSRFFISLQDDLLTRFGMYDSLPDTYRSMRQSEPLVDRVIHKRIEHIQRVIEGQNYDIRLTLNDYSDIVEGHRQAIFTWRQEVLTQPELLSLLSTKCSEKVEHLSVEYSSELIMKAEQQITLFILDQCWSEYLDYAAYIRESIHLERIGRENPLDIFLRRVTEVFLDLPATVEERVIAAFEKAEITESGVDLNKEGLNRPSSTWTYIVNDNFYQNKVSLFRI